MLELDSDLQTVTAIDILEKILKEQEEYVYFHAYFMLEIAYRDKKIIGNFSVQEICWAIAFVMRPLSQRLTSKMMNGLKVDRVEECAKRLIRARYSSGTICEKYSKDLYERVALLPLPKIEL